MNEIIKNTNDVEELNGMMQRLIQISINTQNSVGEIDTKVKKIGDKVTAVSKRMDDFEENSELTTQQRNTIRRTVNQQVYRLLDLPDYKADWTVEDKIKVKKYSHIFHQRCYSEVAKKGHLSTPYGTTKSKDFVQAIEDIEAWTPKNGIKELLQEADENAAATKAAREGGYI